MNSLIDTTAGKVLIMKGLIILLNWLNAGLNIKT